MTASAITQHGVHYFPFASGFATSRACSMKSRATGPSVRFFRVTIAVGTRAVGSSMGKILISGCLVGNLNAEAGKIARNGLDYPRTTVVTFSPEVRIRLLATGRFLAICPASAMRLPGRHPEIKILPVELPTARVPIGIFTLKNRSLNPVAQLFIDHAREVAKPLAKRK
jgi:hypothetical protein